MGRSFGTQARDTTGHKISPLVQVPRPRRVTNRQHTCNLRRPGGIVGPGGNAPGPLTEDGRSRRRPSRTPRPGGGRRGRGVTRKRPPHGWTGVGRSAAVVFLVWAAPREMALGGTSVSVLVATLTLELLASMNPGPTGVSAVQSRAAPPQDGSPCFRRIGDSFRTAPGPHLHGAPPRPHRQGTKVPCHGSGAPPVRRRRPAPRPHRLRRWDDGAPPPSPPRPPPPAGPAPRRGRRCRAPAGPACTAR